MKIRKPVLSAILSLVVASGVVGQSAPQSPASPDAGKGVEEKVDKKALEKKALALIDEILKEAADLRLPENRIRLQAGAADLLWKRDEKRSRALFKQAMESLGGLIAEMGSPQSLRSKSRNPEYANLVRLHAELRRDILQMIAQHDARLAREFLRGTRESRPAGEGNRERDEQELHMELELAGQIATTDPSQALQIVEESLEGGRLRDELPGIIQQLATKDRDAATKLIDALMKRLRAVNLATDTSACGVAVALLRVGTNRNDDDSDSAEKRSSAGSPPQILDDKTLREVADMIAAAALESLSAVSGSADREYNGFALLGVIESLMPDFEKYTPSRAAALKKKIAEAGKNVDPRVKALMEHVGRVDASSVDGLLEAATRAPAGARDALLSQAAMKALADGDADRARQIVSDCSDSNQRDELLEQIDSQALSRATEAGHLDEARQLLSEASIEERIAVLIQFASRASASGDKKAALQILQEARGLVGVQAATGGELLALLQIAETYVTLEPARSFDIVEPLVDQLNRLLAAAAVMDGFDAGRSFKDGELLLLQGDSYLISLVLQFAGDAGMLARADFERARAVADKFQANDMRLTARLAVAQAVLLENPPRRVVASPISGRFFSGSIVINDGGTQQLIFQRSH